MPTSDDNLDRPEEESAMQEMWEKLTAQEGFGPPKDNIRHESFGEEITVVWGEERFAPISYNSFGVGPFTYTTTVRVGESPEQAFERAYKFLATQAQRAFISKRDQFFRNYKGDNK